MADSNGGREASEGSLRISRKIFGKLLEEAMEVRGKRSEDRFERKFLAV
jgi:hypothetical protein